MEDVEARDHAREDRDPERAEDGAADVHAHHAAALGAVKAVLLADDGDVGLAVDRVARADGLAFHAEEQRDGQAEDQRAEEVAELLHDQGPAGIEEHLEVRPDAQADLRQEDQHGDRHELRGAVHFGELQDPELREGEDAAQHQRVEQRQQHDEAEAVHADRFGHDHDDEGQQMKLPVLDEIHVESPSFSCGAKGPVHGCGRSSGGVSRLF